MPESRQDLTTVLKITGGDLYDRTIKASASVHRLLERAQMDQERAAVRLDNTNLRLQRRMAAGGLRGFGIDAPGASRFGLLPALEIGAVMTASAAISSAVSQALDYQRVALSLQGSLKTVGAAVPVRQFEDLARVQSLATGASQEELLTLARQLTMQRASADTTQKLMVLASQMAQSRGTSVEQAAAALEAAHRGQTNALLNEYGIRLKAASGYLIQYSDIAQRIAPQVAESARLMADSSVGASDQMKAAWKDAALALGERLQPASSGFSRFMASVGRGVAATIREGPHYDRFGTNTTFMNAFHNAPGAAAAASGRAIAGRIRSEELLQRIEQNTGPMGPLGRALRGGGAYSEAGGGLHIRDLNSMFRRTNGGG